MPDRTSPTAGGWRWARRGCGCLAVAAGLGGLLSCAAGWFAWDAIAERTERVERIRAEALADGDAETVWTNAVPEFRARHARERFDELVLRHPDLLRAAGARWWNTETVVIAGTTFVVPRLTVADGSAVREVGVYCIAGPDGHWRLLGLRPDFEEAVPADLRAVLRRLQTASHDGGD